MKLLSLFLTLLIFFVALSFALNNRQDAVVNLWPLGIEASAPLYLLTLGALFLGILIGAGFGWLGALPHRIEAHRLRKDIAGLREKIGALQNAGLPQRRKQDKPRGALRFWERRL